MKAILLLTAGFILVLGFTYGVLSAWLEADNNARQDESNIRMCRILSGMVATTYPDQAGNLANCSVGDKHYVLTVDNEWVRK